MPQRFRKWLKKSSLTAGCILLCILTAGCAYHQKKDYPLDSRLSNSREITETIRSGLRNHARAILVMFEYPEEILGELSMATAEWMEEALAETEDPREGDYIRSNYGGYTYTCSYERNAETYVYTVRILPQYFTYLTQEEEVSGKVQEILGSLGLGPHLTEAEKAGRIYDWLCRNVRYDKVHKKNPYQHLKSTAYSAIMLGTATCQGYCAAGYRLLREAGLTCRIVTGSAGREEKHAWLIIGIDDHYYLADPTRDAGKDPRKYFLLGTASAKSYAPDGRFCTEAFASAYPLAEADYEQTLKQ